MRICLCVLSISVLSFVKYTYLQRLYACKYSIQFISQITKKISIYKNNISAGHTCTKGANT